jgi:hypothetical protein
MDARTAASEAHLGRSSSTAAKQADYSEQISSLESIPAIKCLVTGSSLAVDGVSCLEEIYSLLVDILE